MERNFTHRQIPRKKFLDRCQTGDLLIYSKKGGQGWSKRFTKRDFVNVQMVIRLRDMTNSVYLVDGLSARGLRFISFLQMENEIKPDDVIFYRKLKNPLNNTEISRLNGYFEKIVNS
jgi:hypothetical protein